MAKKQSKQPVAARTGDEVPASHAALLSLVRLLARQAARETLATPADEALHANEVE